MWKAICLRTRRDQRCRLFVGVAGRWQAAKPTLRDLSLPGGKSHEHSQSCEFLRGAVSHATDRVVSSHVTSMVVDGARRWFRTGASLVRSIGSKQQTAGSRQQTRSFCVLYVPEASLTFRPVNDATVLWIRRFTAHPPRRPYQPSTLGCHAAAITSLPAHYSEFTGCPEYRHAKHISWEEMSL